MHAGGNATGGCDDHDHEKLGSEILTLSIQEKKKVTPTHGPMPIPADGNWGVAG